MSDCKLTYEDWYAVHCPECGGCYSADECDSMHWYADGDDDGDNDCTTHCDAPECECERCDDCNRPLHIHYMQGYCPADGMPDAWRVNDDA